VPPQPIRTSASRGTNSRTTERSPIAKAPANAAPAPLGHVSNLRPDESLTPRSTRAERVSGGDIALHAGTCDARRTHGHATPTVDHSGNLRGRVRIGLARRSGRRRRCRWLRRVSGSAGARSILFDERGLHRGFTHRELLRPGTDLRSSCDRTGALRDARSAM